ncbi:hypothetical protein F5887DRAFT_76369 [Amanita rubescens]|nr:hypothetical protein F5887DRAFT_76369 [Amanita rubescens]
MLSRTFTAVFALILALPLGLATQWQAPTINVQVGPNNQQVFQPQIVNASNGEIIQFIFFPGTHTVTQSSFDQPCTRNGFNSGQISVNQNQQQYPTFQIQVNDNQPIYIYSGADNDCQNGMVFAVNINQQRFQEFQQRARQQPRQNQNQNNQNQKPEPEPEQPEPEP